MEALHEVASSALCTIVTVWRPAVLLPSLSLRILLLLYCRVLLLLLLLLLVQRLLLALLLLLQQ
jgi:hypothetical protein